MNKEKLFIVLMRKEYLFQHDRTSRWKFKTMRLDHCIITFRDKSVTRRQTNLPVMVYLVTLRFNHNPLWGSCFSYLGSPLCAQQMMTACKCTHHFKTSTMQNTQTILCAVTFASFVSSAVFKISSLGCWAFLPDAIAFLMYEPIRHDMCRLDTLDSYDTMPH